MSARKIIEQLRALIGFKATPDLVSAVTDKVLEVIADLQARPLEPVYPLDFFNALRVKANDEGHRPHTSSSAATLRSGATALPNPSP